MDNSLCFIINYSNKHAELKLEHITLALQGATSFIHGFNLNLKLYLPALQRTLMPLHAEDA